MYVGMYQNKRLQVISSIQHIKYIIQSRNLKFIKVFEINHNQGFLIDHKFISYSEVHLR